MEQQRWPCTWTASWRRTWQPVVWEWSSGLMWLALAWPIVWFSRRFPFHIDNWPRQLRWHLLASVVVSLVHVLGMVGLRTLAYRSQGLDYEFGPWPRELFYEYVKDVRSYAGMVVLLGFYRLLLRRLQGEASLLAELALTRRDASFCTVRIMPCDQRASVDFRTLPDRPHTGKVLSY